MPYLIVASHNPVKLQACQAGFALVFPGQACEVAGVAVPSGVAAQPQTDAETWRGARNRAAGAHAGHAGADFYVGIEGGVEWRADQLFAFAWVVAIGADGQVGQARTAAFQLPAPVAELVRQGHELGHADDLVFGASNSKQQGGAIGLLTGQALDRAGLYAPAVAMSLLCFRHPGLYPGQLTVLP
jgi:inosine/xanthosine triphosphatase